ncbi:hypothetical protein [Thermoanaerobacter uzonensis]|uniref:hypothetical protein n=1 Tax=Thermoanaerobacter uzonensis TaxID=447593 RepID=UPI003D76714A
MLNEVVSQEKDIRKEVYARIGYELRKAIQDLDEEHQAALIDGLKGNPEIYATISALIDVLDELDGFNGTLLW